MKLRMTANAPDSAHKRQVVLVGKRLASGCASSTMSIAISTARQGDHRQRVATAGRMGLRDRHLVGGTVIWASPSGQTYVTTPGSTLLFPSLCVPSGEPPVADVPVDHCATVVR